MAEENHGTVDETKQKNIPRYVLVVPKILQLIFSIFAIGLLVDPLNSLQRTFNKPRFKLDDAAFIYVTIAGYILINTLFLISHLLGDRLPKRTITLFASVGALLHVVAGSLIVHNWRTIQTPYYHLNNEIYPSKQYMDMLISSAVFVFVNVLAFMLDIFMMVKYS